MDSEQLMPASDRHVTQKVSIIFSISLFAGYTVFGIGSSLAAPALLDIALLVHSSFAAVSYGLVLRSIGYGMGGLICGWLYRYLNRQIGVIICLFISGLLILAVPFTRNVYLYIAVEGIYGFFTGGIDCASNAWIMELWPGNSSPFMQALHFFFALGMVVAPLIDEPFLVPLNSTNETDHNNHFLSPLTLDSSQVLEAKENGSNVLIPYLIGAAGFFLVAILQLILRFNIHYEIPTGEQAKNRTMSVASSTSQNNTTAVAAAAKAQKSKKYKMMVMALAMLLFISYASTEMNTFTFIAEFAVYCDLKQSKSTGAFMSSVMAASFAVSRGLSAFVAAKIPPKFMLYGSVGIIVTGNLLLILWANTSLIGLWVAVVILGSGHSSIIGNLYSFLEERIEMTTLVCGCCMFSCCIGSIVSPIIVGRLLKSHPSVFGFINVAGLSVVLILLALFQLTDRLFARQRESRD